MAPAVWAPARWSLCSRATSSILVVDSLLKLTCKINQTGSISCLHENLRHRLRQIYSTEGVTFVPVAPLLLTVVGDFNGLVSVRMKPPFKMYYFFQRKPSFSIRSQDAVVALGHACCFSLQRSVMHHAPCTMVCLKSAHVSLLACTLAKEGQVVF